MSNTKRHYNKGLDFLKQAQIALEEASIHFSACSNSIDDFPTARHEVMDLSIEAQKLKVLVDRLESKAFINRIK